MLGQLQRLQEEMAKAQRQLEDETVTVTGAGGAITIVITGSQTLRSVTVAPEALRAADPEMLGDMILTAVNQAIQASKDMAQKKLGAFLP